MKVEIGNATLYLGDCLEVLPLIDMKKLIVGIYLSLVATVVWASCSTHTYMFNGKIVTCTTCCYGEGQFRSCTTTCI